MKRAIIKMEYYRYFPDEMTDDEIKTVSYYVTAGKLEYDLMGNRAAIIDVDVSTIEDVEEDEAEALSE